MTFKNKIVLITGGTGSVSKFIIDHLLSLSVKKIIIFSRDEFKQYELNLRLKKYNNIFDFIIGDIRDYNSINSALRNVDFVIHTAALKHVDVCEKNPEETIKTNIIGSQNLIHACIENKIKKVVSLSTDKASMPINLYGASKLVSDKLFVASNMNQNKTIFSVVRYGNVFLSRGSVFPYFISLIEKGIKELPLTDKEMTRFWISPTEAIKTIFYTFKTMKGGEIIVPKIRSFKVIDLIRALNCKIKITGLRKGEKIHETLICKDDTRFTIEGKKYYIILPPFSYQKQANKYKDYKKVNINFEYFSNLDRNFLNVKQIKNFINFNDD